MSSHVKLYIPGPVEVSADTFAAMSQPMIGHRGKGFSDMYAEIHPMLQQLFGTTGLVFLSTSSAFGIMEGCIRNLVAKKVLNCCNGAFSDKWHDVSKRCGKQAEAYTVDWGKPVMADEIDKRLATGEFDAVTFIHNETSTGVLSPIAEIAALKKKYPDVMFITDSVSGFTTVPVNFDELGLDVLLTGSQKAFALPPGLALFTASEAAMARAATINDRGYYFDFLEFKANGEKSMTPSTPCISLIYGLRHQLKKMIAEGLDNRYARHAKLNGLVHDWVTRNGFEFFAPEGYRSKSLTCVSNNKGIDVAALIGLLKKNHGLIIDGGYGKLKGKTFRISNMGDETEESINAVIAALDDSLAKLG
ncbi:pyridoxal-phosphate-dependent aminotransferase family protein [Brevifollis gellanilyticus]|uniref:Aminotransferase n=1 Tax=Brevifollis gellanilyticus TaxID=748831 RepID=A0A512M8K3_9BACT|nr:alanine--glyoxylate aminotransferase family protein [Brevifollis gellanilyticus]GEP43069.1 aminotransferase [Brevifollis gellanilyticus]